MSDLMAKFSVRTFLTFTIFSFYTEMFIMVCRPIHGNVEHSISDLHHSCPTTKFKWISINKNNDQLGVYLGQNLTYSS